MYYYEISYILRNVIHLAQIQINDRARINMLLSDFENDYQTGGELIS